VTELTRKYQKPLRTGLETEIGRLQEIPKLLRYGIYVIFVAGASLSVPNIGSAQYSLLPVGNLLDLWICILAITLVIRGQTVGSGMVLFICGYAITRIIPAVASETALSDFITAYKWLLYALVFCLAVGRKWGDLRGLFRLTRILFAMALAKTLVTLAVFGGDTRSGLLTENNFEIALFVGLVIALYAHMSPRDRFASVATVGILTALSGSRSGVIALVILALYVVVQARKMNLFGRYILGLGIAVVGWFAWSVFASRLEVGGTIDRLFFLDVFWRETSAWSPIQWLFGTLPLTPLSSTGCGQLSYYRFLFSSSGDGSCYSVIFHAFTMRVIFDAGIFGLIVALAAATYGLLRGRVARSTTFALLAVAFTNGLSVSGLNNAYVALPILIAILTAPGAGISIDGNRSKIAGSRYRSTPLS
jgi:hypothetical protein